MVTIATWFCLIVCLHQSACQFLSIVAPCRDTVRLNPSPLPDDHPPPHSSHFTCSFSLFSSSVSPLLFFSSAILYPPVSFLTSLFLPFTHVTVSPFLFFSSCRAWRECQDGHLCCLLCSALQHTNSHHHLSTAGGRGIRHHGDSRHAPCPPLHPSPRSCGCPQSPGEGQEPQDSAGLLHPPHLPCDCAPWGFGRPHGSGAARTTVLPDVSWGRVAESICLNTYKRYSA